jgi:HEAT repeat protein
VDDLSPSEEPWRDPQIDLEYEQVHDALNAAGVPCWDIHQLRDDAVVAAVPILIDQFSKVSTYPVRAAIIGAWGEKPAAPLTRQLLVELYQSPALSAGERERVAESLRLIATPSMFADIFRLVMLTQYSASRWPLVYALGRYRRPEVVEALVGMLDDEAPTVYYAIKSLGRMRELGKPALPALYRMRNAPDTDIRAAARAAVDQISRNRAIG